MAARILRRAGKVNLIGARCRISYLEAPGFVGARSGACAQAPLDGLWPRVRRLTDDCPNPFPARPDRGELPDWLPRLWRPGRADRPDAPGLCRREEMARRGGIPARPELLHVAAGAGGAAAGDLCRMAAARGVGRGNCRRAVRAAGGADRVRPDLALCDARDNAHRRGAVLWHQGSSDRLHPRGAVEGRQAGAEDGGRCCARAARFPWPAPVCPALPAGDCGGGGDRPCPEFRGGAGCRRRKEGGGTENREGICHGARLGGGVVCAGDRGVRDARAGPRADAGGCPVLEAGARDLRRRLYRARLPAAAGGGGRRLADGPADD